MNKYAFINNNLIVEIREADADASFHDAHLFQNVIDISLIDPQPQVGWSYELGRLFKKLPDVTPRQMRQALILSGVELDMIDAALNTLPEPTRSLAKTEWEYSIAFKRDRPLVITVGLMLGWTPAQLDQLWEFAWTL